PRQSTRRARSIGRGRRPRQTKGPLEHRAAPAMGVSMIGRRTRLVVLVALGLAGVAALVRPRRRVATGRVVPGGVLIGDAGRYDLLSRLVSGPLFRGIAANVAAFVPTDSRVLEIGCGPGLLSIRLAETHGLDVTGIDLDPAMIELARANAVRSRVEVGRPPSFIVGDAEVMPFGDATFGAVVSTFSMHHWSDRARGLA